MTTRVRDFTSLQQQDEKMMAMGKLSAGLAHELNNPAAAIVRGSASLLKHLKLEPEAFRTVMAIKMEEKDVDLVSKKLFEILGREKKPVLTLMQRTECEDELRDWMDERRVTHSDEIAENFLDYGFTCDDLGSFTDHIPAAALSPVFNWINSNLVTERMVQDIPDLLAAYFRAGERREEFHPYGPGQGEGICGYPVGDPQYADDAELQTEERQYQRGGAV